MRILLKKKKRSTSTMGKSCLHRYFWFIKKYSKITSKVLLKKIDKIIVLWMQTLYKLHIRIRGVHDKAYKNIKVYKKYSDWPLSRSIRKTTITAFLISFVCFFFLQNIWPNIFNLGSPNTAFAGANTKTWTTKGDLESGIPDANVNLSGINAGDDSNASLNYSTTWANQNLKRNLPDGRRGHTAIWTGETGNSATANKMIVWGGSGPSNVIYADGGIYDPSTNSWKSISTVNAPIKRHRHTAIWTGTKMIVWGGLSTNYTYDVLNTGGVYDPATDSWTSITTTNAPTSRSSHTAIWTGSQMIIWGGQGYNYQSVYLNDGYSYNPETNSWSSITLTSAPDVRYGHTAVWTGSRMIIWGGYNGSVYSNTGGIYNPSNDSWMSTSITDVPTARYNHTAVWTGSKMIVWGGQSNVNYNTGGIYDLAADTWIATSISNAPAARYGQTAAWTGSKMIVWGGFGGSYFNTGGIYDPGLDTWAATSSDNVPVARIFHTSVWTGSKMIVWGGSDSGGIHINTGGVYDATSDGWSATLYAYSPAARYNHSAVWTGSKMIIWGGYATNNYTNTGGVYDLTADTWTATQATGAPTAREGHSAVWTGEKMIIWSGNSVGNTGGLYNLATNSWTSTSTTNAPSGRRWHTTIWTGSRMIVWGGFDGTNKFNDGGSYDPSSNTWSSISTTGAPTARYSSSAVWTGSKMIVWGGNTGGATYLNDGGIYDPATDTWSVISTVSAPTARYGHTAVWTGSKMIVWGGLPSNNTGGIYDPATDTWSATSTVNAPSARYYHTAVFCNSKMIVWGGYYGINTGGIYDPSTNSWTTTSTVGAPTGRHYHTAVTDGERMIIWGGSGGGNTGGIFGNLYSSPGLIPSFHLSAGSKATWSSLSWNGTTPTNTAIKFRTRGAETEGGLASASWSSYYTSSPATLTTSASQWLEVELTLESSDGANTPTLNDFTINYDTLEAPTSPKSFKTDGTEITVPNTNGYTNETSVVTKATIPAIEGFPTDGSIVLTPEIELRTDTSFTGTNGVPAGVTFTPTNHNYVGAENDISFGTISGISPDTTYNYKIRFTDNSGRVSPWSTSYSTVSVEQTSPTGTVSINSGAQFATSTNVTLTLSAFDTGGSTLKSMRFSNDGTTWSDWETYNTTKAWTLDSGDGAKNVYAQFKDGAGNVTGTWVQTSREDFQLGNVSGEASTTSNGGTISLSRNPQITALRPIANGLYSQNWAPTPVSGQLWDKVDEEVLNTSDYIQTWQTTKALFATGNTTFTNETITNVKLYINGNGWDGCGGGTGYFQPGFYDGTGEWYGNQTNSNINVNLPINPRTGSAWTTNEINNLQIGVSATAECFAIDIHQVYSEITYTASGTTMTGDFTSSTKDNITAQTYGVLSFGSSVPAQTGNDALRFQVASNNDNSTWNFIGPDGTNATYYTASGTQLHSSHNGHRYIKYKAYLQTADVSYTPTVYDVSIEVNTGISDAITLDTTPPSNISNLKSYQDNTKSNLLNETTWYDYTAPYFEWDANADGDFKEYKYCFSTSSSCDPTVGTSLGTTNNYTANLVAGSDGPRYFRVVAIDNADNPSTTVTQVIYKLDLSLPGAVTGYTASQTYEDYIRVSWSPVGAAGGSSIRYVLERIPYQTYIEDGYTKLDVEPDKVWSDLTTYKAFDPTTNTSIDEYVSTDEGIVNRLQAGVKYVYRIRAIDELNRYGNYQNDPFFGLTRDGLDPLPPTNVTALACSYQNPENCETTDNALKGHQAIIRWAPGSDAGTGIIAYRIYRATTNHQLEASYSLLTTINVPNPLPAMDEYDTLLYYDNNLTDYTTYHYRIVAVDGSDPANTSRIVKNLTDVGNYAYTITPDVTAPTTPVPSTAGGGLDSSNEYQKVIITWSPSTDTGVGIKTYKLYRADRYDETDLSGTLTDNDFIEITASASVTCTMNSRECVEEGLEDNRYYYYRLKAVDNDPYNNESPYSATSTVKTSSSAVPSPARGRKDPNTQIYEPFPYAISTKGDPTITNSTVGTEITLTFTGSYLKDNLPYLLKYEIYRSTDRTNWTKIGNDITPIRNDDDRDNTYTFTDSNLDDATTYYYKVRSVGNNPDIEGGGESYSGIGNNLNQAWDITPDVTGPMIPAELKVKDIHDDGMNFKRNIITWQRVTTPTRDEINDFREYRVYKSTDGLVWNQILVDGLNPLYNADKEIALATNYYMDLIPVAEANQYYYYYVTAVDDAGDSFRYDTDDIINPYSNESIPPRDSEGRIIAVSLNPAIAKPTITNQVGGLKAKVYDVGVSSAVIEWNADQSSDSVVEFRAVNDAKWITIGDRVMKNYNEPHIVRLFGLSPETTYNYKIISRNSLGNEDIIGDVAGELALLPTLTTSGFTITPGTVTTTTSTTEITWSTNLNASSAFVEYQLQKQPGDEPQGGTAGVDPSVIITSPKNHKVVLKGLRSARTYTYKIKSISSDGYLSEYPGGEFANFKTRSFDSEQFTLAPSSSNVAERNITATTAQIVWQTENPTTSWVDYSTKSGTYDNAAGNNDMVGTHVVVIEGLIPGTTYYYRVRVKDANEVEYTSQEYSFTAILKPKISNMTVKNITPYSVTIAWDTNVDTETIINWGTTTAYGEKRGKSGVSKVHELTIDNLLDNQEYHYQILAKDDAGNEVADTDKIVRTPLDTEGPKITGVKLDVLPMGENDTTSSVIVTWQTNKPATTLVEYDEGVIGGTYNKSSVEDTSLNNSHTVIIKDLQPASSYHYRLVSADKRSNKTVSQDYTFVTPSKEKSIIQLIIKSLEETFAWTKNLNQFFGNIGRRLSGN